MVELRSTEEASQARTKLLVVSLGSRHVLFLVGPQGVLSTLYAFSPSTFTCVLLPTEDIISCNCPKQKSSPEGRREANHRAVAHYSGEKQAEIVWPPSQRDPWTRGMHCSKPCGVSLGSAMSASSYPLKEVGSMKLYHQILPMPNYISIKCFLVERQNLKLGQE